MVYTIEFTEVALKQLKKLPRDIQEKVTASLERIRIRPDAFVKRLVGVNAYSFRVGDYRLILDIDNGKLIILVLKMGHRKKVYDF